LKLINRVGTKYKKALKKISYVSIAMGYVLMSGILYLFGKIVYIYLFRQDIVRAIKIPPIIPLVPYLPQAFKLDFLPPFYFTYWILIIALIAITHEFAHGIFAARDKIKIKSTGFGFFPFFFPVFLAAFVEPDEKQMNRKSRFSQMAVLSAGTFANVITAILFFVIFVLFFMAAFQPSGVVFDDYVYSTIAITTISSINNVSLENHTYEEVLSLVNTTGDNTAEVYGKKYVGIDFFINSVEYLKLYDDAPAINARLERIILKINGVETKNKEVLLEELSKYSPGDTITLTVPEEDGGSYNKDLILGKHPEYPEEPWLGIGFSEREGNRISEKITIWLTSFKDPHTYYKPKIDGFSVFIYNLLWWTILISISVALVNMLPLGMFDGGRFFYLTILSLTKSEKIARKSFSFMTRFLLFLLLLIMASWFFSLF